tara:strand:- start:14947 stop:15708 length:762 start_codon:yes stop_codon:yes gene_type:complete
MSVLKNIGARINGIILRNRVLNFMDLCIESCFTLFPNRANRRYKSFIGNYFITTAKHSNIKKYTSQLTAGKTIVDIGCAEGSLLYRLRAIYKDHHFYGCDSGYSLLYENQNTLYSNLFFHDLDINHPHYSPNGACKSESVSLGLPASVDLVIMYDVLPYLNERTQINYLKQIAESLKVGGELIMTAMLETASGVSIGGAKGESYQFTTELDAFLVLARAQKLIITDFAIGNWDATRVRWDIRDIDLLVFKKIH